MPIDTAASEAFFERYARLFDTSRTRKIPNRLLARHATIFGALGVDFAGKTVLDLGSHDGRWSIAALDQGASRVVGIEARGDMVEDAQRTCADMGFGPDRCEFIVGDVVDTLDTLQDKSFDIVLNLGFFYHTIQHVEILDRLRPINPGQMIVDTGISDIEGHVIELRLEDTSDARMSIDYGTSRTGRVITGRPSKDALTFMLDVHDADVRYHDWSQWTGSWEGIEDYQAGHRITALSTRRTA